MAKTLPELKVYLGDLAKEGKISLEVVQEVTSTIDESAATINGLNKENKELQDKVVDLVMNTPVSIQPLNQDDKNPPQPKSLEECLEEEAQKLKQNNK